MASKIQFGLKHTYFESCVLHAEIAFNCAMVNVYFSSMRPDFIGELWVEIIFWLTVFIFFISGSCHNEFSGNKGKAAKNPRLVQHQYPIFIFYPKDRRGIQYNGPISVQSILEFLILARKPATHLGLKNDLVNLRANHGNAHKVHIFWEGHKILRNLHLTFLYVL